MNTSPLRIPSATNSRVEELYPKLTAAQIARVASHGHSRQVKRGEVLLEAGERTDRFFVVTSGQIEVVHPTCETDRLIAVLGLGLFTGEVNLLSGRRGLVQIRVSEHGEVIEVDRQQLLALVQTDSELTDLLMRAFILRRVELLAHGFGDVVLLAGC